MRGFAQLTLKRFSMQGALPPEELQHALEVMDQQSAKLARLVAQLLDVSRIEAGQLRLECQPADLVPLVEEVVALAQARCRVRPFTVRGPASLGPWSIPCGWSRC